MAMRDDIQKNMSVYSSDNVEVGHVDHVDDNGIKLTRKDSADGQHHHLPMSAIARVDSGVRLNKSAADLAAMGISAGTGAAAGTAGAATGATATGLPPLHNPAVPDAPKRTNYYLPWILLALGLLILLLLLLRGCNTTKVADAPPPANAPATAPLAVESVTLPGGQKIDLEPNTLNYALQRYLASNEPAPRTFTFDKLNFDTDSSAIRDVDTANIDALAQILSAYPAAKANIVGYADARGSGPANATLGAERASSVVKALTGKGVAADRLSAVTGGESNPKATNATAEGQFENRRTELVVTAK